MSEVFTRRGFAALLLGGLSAVAVACQAIHIQELTVVVTPSEHDPDTWVHTCTYTMANGLPNAVKIYSNPYQREHPEWQVDRERQLISFCRENIWREEGR